MDTNVNEPLAQGWIRPPGARLWHYMIGTDSVCALWYLPVPHLAPAPPRDARICRACRRYIESPRLGGRERMGL